MEKIVIRGAREHNLKNLDLELPRDRLIVFTGVSGSGKSSLAFDTIYAEGQRRYVESLSSYARQFLGQMEKPKVDYIGGLSPAISIEQKTTSKNPRSTVGTITEIYDYLRVLYARIGIPHCHQCGRQIGAQTIDQIIEQIMSLPPGSKFMVLAPKIKERKGEYKDILDEVRQEGFLRVRINGEVHLLEEEIRLNKKMKHTIDLVIDRLTLREDIRSRLYDSVSIALQQGEDTVKVVVEGEAEKLFSRKNACVVCGISFGELTPQSFSFNSPQGMCPTCDGLGRKLEFAEDLIVPKPELSIDEGAIVPWKSAFAPTSDSNWGRHIRRNIQALAKDFEFDVKAPWKDLDRRVQEVILNGPGEDKFSKQHWRAKVHYEGVIAQLEHWFRNSSSEAVREWCMERFMRDNPCPDCGGGRVRPESRAVTVGEKNIVEVTRLGVAECLEFFQTLELPPQALQIAGEVLREIIGRLQFLNNVGLYYLTLERSSPSLSGGEAQRIRLASQIGSGLVGVLYILDEPTIGLHQRDNAKLLSTLVDLRELGNTVLVVEHDEHVIRAADYIVDFGPGAGVHGGYVVSKGTPAEILADTNSMTGCYLSGQCSIPVPTERRSAEDGWLIVRGAQENNLKNIDVHFPLGTLTCVTGVSGSGKSSLVNEILYKALSRELYRANMAPGKYRRIEGDGKIDKVINVDQSPIGRTPRSNPATYVKVFDPIRNLFAALPDAKVRGYKPGHFSFNVPGGRCEACQGDGQKRIEMHFLADVYVTCDVCKGRRFNRETLLVKYKGLNVADVLDLTVKEALEFFASQPRIVRILRTLADVGLSYIHLGQPAPTLSGGEAQRVKLAKELCRTATGRTFYILDEPTTGLHFADVEKLLRVLNRLVERGNTVVVIEHNLDVIKSADWVIDLGPEGGDEGGRIVATGTPEELVHHPTSYTGEFLRDVLYGRGEPVKARR